MWKQRLSSLALIIFILFATFRFYIPAPEQAVYVTFYDNAEYENAVDVLFCSLIKSNILSTRHPLLAYTSALALYEHPPLHWRNNSRIQVRLLSSAEFNFYLKYNTSRFVSTWKKLSLWWALEHEAFKWSRMIFLDADTLVLNNGILALESWPLLPAFSADVIPPDRLNSGVFVMHVRKAPEYRARILKALSEPFPAIDGSEQDVLNAVFREAWWGTGAVLPARFNWHAWQWNRHPSAFRAANVSILHYTGDMRVKPFWKDLKLNYMDKEWQTSMRPWFAIKDMCRT